CEEHKFLARPVATFWHDQKEGILRLHNRYAFKDLSTTRLEWEIRINGKSVHKAEMPAPHTEPEKHSLVQLNNWPVADFSENDEVLLHLRYVETETVSWNDGEFILAEEQL